MTGGQYSPTTPKNGWATTSPYGNLEDNVDPVKLAITSGATYVARSTVFHYSLTTKYIENAIKHKGMSVVEVITNCHTYFGRYNQMPKPIQMLQYFKENTVTLSRAEKMNESELEHKIIIGEFVNIEKESYNERYEKLIKELSAGEVRER